MINIEELVADAVLQNPVEVEIDGKKMMVSKPTLGTLIEASAYLNELCDVSIINVATSSPEQIIGYCLANAINCAVYADVLATLIVGRKNKETQREGVFARIKGMFVKKKRDYHAEVAERILKTMSCKEIADLFAKLIGLQELGFFLQLTTTLREINLLKPTRK